MSSLHTSWWSAILELSKELLHNSLVVAYWIAFFQFKFFISGFRAKEIVLQTILLIRYVVNCCLQLYILLRKDFLVFCKYLFFDIFDNPLINVSAIDLAIPNNCLDVIHNFFVSNSVFWWAWIKTMSERSFKCCISLTIANLLIFALPCTLARSNHAILCNSFKVLSFSIREWSCWLF